MRVVSTQGVPTGERFTFWRELSGQTSVPYEARCDQRAEADFRAEVRISQFGSMRMMLQTATPYEIHRTRKLIRRSDPECYQLTLGVPGTHGVIMQGDRQASLLSGDLVFYDSSRPSSGFLMPEVRDNHVVTNKPAYLAVG